jgi:hypothetical protein
MYKKVDSFILLQSAMDGRMWLCKLFSGPKVLVIFVDFPDAVTS